VGSCIFGDSVFKIVMRKIIWGISIGVLLAVAFETSDISPPFSSSVRIIFAGDIMLSRQIGRIMERQGDYNFPFELVAEKVRSADIAFGNLENPVSDRGTNVGSIYSFRADPQSLSGLKWAGFDVVSLANNHILDWGRDAFSDTLRHLSEAGIKGVGIGENYGDAHKPARIKASRQGFCLFAYSEFASKAYIGDVSQTVANIDKNQIFTDIDIAKGNNCDVVVVSLHWGNEYEIVPMEWQKELAHTLIDNGALLVIGHHPHVVQPVERYKDGIIAYSLGNFIFDQNFSEDTGKGIVLEVVIDDSKIKEVEEIKIKFNNKFQPYIVGQSGV